MIRIGIVLVCSVALAVVASACAPTPSAVESSPRVQWLRDHSTPIRSISADDEDFADLQPLKARLAGVRVVLLGEATHGDGATFEGKVRLVKFLHRELGFRVLAFESGLFDCDKAEALIEAGSPAAAVATRAVFGLWSESEQVQPLWRYLDVTRRRDTLQLAGFDFQYTGTLSRESLAADLSTHLGGLHGFGTSDFPWWQPVESTLAALFKGGREFQKMPPQKQEEFYRASAALRNRLENRADASPRDSFWGQVLKSNEQLARFLWNVDFEHPKAEVMNLRDQQMADNLLWLLREKYPRSNVIVWAATSHIIHARQSIRSVNGGAIGDAGMIPMGDTVRKTLGNAAYVLGFTAYTGRSGVRGRTPWDIAEARSDSLEDLLFRTGREYAWLDLGSGEAGAPWLREAIVARPLGYVPMRAVWGQVLDGILFVRTMTASRAVE